MKDNVIHLDKYRAELKAPAPHITEKGWEVRGPDCHLFLDDEWTSHLVTAALNNAYRAGLKAARDGANQ